MTINIADATMGWVHGREDKKCVKSLVWKCYELGTPRKLGNVTVRKILGNERWM
jgi:hypothetical protein